MCSQLRGTESDPMQNQSSGSFCYLFNTVTNKDCKTLMLRNINAVNICILQNL